MNQEVSELEFTFVGAEEVASAPNSPIATKLEGLDTDEPVNLKESEDIEIIAVYSATVEDESMARDITYIMTIIDETPVALVTEQMEDASEIHYTETENTDLQALYNEWLDGNQ